MVHLLSSDDAHKMFDGAYLGILSMSKFSNKFDSAIELLDIMKQCESYIFDILSEYKICKTYKTNNEQYIATLQNTISEMNNKNRELEDTNVEYITSLNNTIIKLHRAIEDRDKLMQKFNKSIVIQNKK